MSEKVTRWEDGGESGAVRVLGRSSGNLVKVELRGDLGRDDLLSLKTKLRKLVEEHGKLRILVALDGATGWQRASVDVDGGQLELDTERRIERMAIVSDARSAAPAQRFLGPLGETTRLFRPEEEEQAWTWLSGLAAS